MPGDPGVLLLTQGHWRGLKIVGPVGREYGLPGQSCARWSETSNIMSVKHQEKTSNHAVTPGKLIKLTGLPEATSQADPMAIT